MAATNVRCHQCGKEFLKYGSQVRAHNFCCKAHATQWLAARCTQYNRYDNPMNQPGGVLAARIRRSEALRAAERGQSYRKLLGQHEHRVIAEEMTGRALLPGEIVHHMDGNRRNNDPSNLAVLPSRTVHAEIHRGNKGRWCR